LSATATFGLAAFSSAAPVAVRSQSVLLGVNRILQDDCEILFSEEMLEEVPDVVSSPMQLYISSYPMGLIVGDFILIFVLTFVWFLFYYLVENYVVPYFRKTQSRNRIPSLFSNYFISKSKVMIPLFNFSMIFVDPMWNSSIALLAIESVGIGWKILGVLISIVILLCGFFFFIIFYKLLYSRTVIEKFRKFRPYEQKRSKNFFLKIWYMMMEPEGEWRSLRIGMSIEELNKTKETKNNKNKNNHKNRKNNKHNSIVKQDDVFLWRICEPIIDGYTARFPRFVVVDILTILGLSLATIIGNATGNCLVLGVLMLVPLFLHFVLAAFCRPEQELLLRIITPSADLLQIVLVICALAKVDGSGIEVLALILLILQMILFLLALVSLTLTLVEFVQENFFQKKEEVRSKKSLSSLSQVMKKGLEEVPTNRKRSNERETRNHNEQRGRRIIEYSSSNRPSAVAVAHSNERNRQHREEETTPSRNRNQHNIGRSYHNNNNDDDEFPRRRTESHRRNEYCNYSEEMRRRDDFDQRRRGNNSNAVKNIKSNNY
jgi:hypothetical protein